MSATPHNQSAIDAMGAQFKTNVFDKAPGKLLGAHKNAVKAAHRQAATAAASRNAWANSAAQTVAQGRKNFAQNQATAVKTAQSAAKAHASAVKSGKAAPTPGTAPRTFAMPAGPQGVQQRAQTATMASQVNNAHSDALKEANDRQKTMTSQRNFAHGQAITEASKRAKEAQRGSAATPTRAKTTSLAPQAPSGSGQQSFYNQNEDSGWTHQVGTIQPSGVNTPDAPLNHPHVPGPAPAASHGPQFANVTTRDNSPFPTHEHPEGSSNLRLNNLSDKQPAPNEFTVGSRANKPGGIASKGSQLEAWAISKQNAVQARQTSRKAGGRDKDLAANAKKAENFANQPLSKFAP